MDKYIGRLLDNRYEILEVLGTGGMAVVYKARCHRLNRLVAIKILKDDFMEDEEFRRRFHSESQAVAMLSHPNIVSIYDVSSSVSADYIVMELIDGITLKQYMEKKGVLNWKETLHFAIQIAKALEHAHGRGIVHRDIKPHNVMVLKNGSVKVTDFGIARMMSKGNTLTKEALGSVHYISPEQAKGGRVDSRSDLYSLGIVMYEMMSGRPPYDGESPVAVAIAHINGGAALPSTLNPNIPGGLEQIIMKAMAHNPAERFGSAADMLRDMDEFRKYPAILFDYNTPPTDEVTRLPRPPIVFETPQTPTTADRIEQAAAVEEAGMAVSQQPKQQPVNKEKARSHPQPADKKDGGSWPPERRKTAPAKKKGGNTAAIAVIACSITIILALIVFLIIRFSGDDEPLEKVEVPNLIGQSYELHKKHSDFEIWIDKEQYSDEYEAGEIIYQSPSAGTMVDKKSKINVYVSLGKLTEPKYMPDLTNKTLEDAKKTLDDLSMGIKFEEVHMNSDTVEAGYVIETNPSKSTELTLDMTVTLVVSDGKAIESKSIPNEIKNVMLWREPDGTDEAETEAPALTEKETKELLDALALDLVYQPSKEQYHNYIKAGDLIGIEADPEIKNYKLNTGDKVTLIISKGREELTKEVPQEIQQINNWVKGSEPVPSLTEEEAKALLDALGLFLEYQPTIQETNSDFKAGDLIRMEPAVTELKTGDKVTLVVCSGPVIKKVPDLMGMQKSKAENTLKYAGFYTYKFVEAFDPAPVNSVVDQSAEPGTELPSTTEIIVTISKGPEPVETISKSFTIDMKGLADDGECMVTIERDGVPMSQIKVEQGKKEFSFTDESEPGVVHYKIIAGETVLEEFDWTYE